MFVGTVTLTKSKTQPVIGSFREVKYLYMGDQAHLVQPEDLGERTDVDASDCSIAQAKKKQSKTLFAA